MVPEGAMGTIISAYIQPRTGYVVMMQCSMHFPGIAADLSGAFIPAEGTPSNPSERFYFRVGGQVYPVPTFDTSNPSAATEARRVRWPGQTEFLDALFAGATLDVLRQSEVTGARELIASFPSPPRPEGLALMVQDCGSGARADQYVQTRPGLDTHIVGKWFLEERSENFNAPIARHTEGLFAVFCDAAGRPAAYTDGPVLPDYAATELALEIASVREIVPAVMWKGLAIFALSDAVIAAMSAGHPVAVAPVGRTAPRLDTQGFSAAHAHALSACS